MNNTDKNSQNIQKSANFSSIFSLIDNKLSELQSAINSGKSKAKIKTLAYEIYELFEDLKGYIKKFADRSDE